MSDNTQRTPLATIEAFESLAFRIACVARQLLAEHPDLPLMEMRPCAFGSSTTVSTSSELDITAYDTDAVRAWATALGTTVDVRFHDADSVVARFEYHCAKATVDGVRVHVGSTRQPTEDEVAAWRAKQETAATKEGAESASGGAQ